MLDAGGFDDGASIRALLEQKYAARLGDRAQRQKVLAALARRGFGYGDCRAAMEEYLSLIHISMKERVASTAFWAALGRSRAEGSGAEVTSYSL